MRTSLSSSPYWRQTIIIQLLSWTRHRGDGHPDRSHARSRVSITRGSLIISSRTRDTPASTTIAAVELQNDMLPHVSRRVIKRGFKDPHAGIININKHRYIPGHDGIYFLRYKISYGRYKPADVRCRDSRRSKSTLTPITHVGDYCETLARVAGWVHT